MNIFILDKNATVAASYLCTIHINKMLLESAQLLSACCNRLFNESKQIDGLYQSTHLNRPNEVWLRESQANFKWLLEHGAIISSIYQQNKCKIHQSSKVIVRAAKYFDGNYYKLPDEYKLEDCTLPYLVMTTEFNHLQKKYGQPIVRGKNTHYRANSWEDAVIAYREYYKAKQFKRGQMTWYGNNKPEWY